jgi:hypothetical protein
MRGAPNSSPAIRLQVVMFEHRVKFTFYALHESSHEFCVLLVGAVPDPGVFTTLGGAGAFSTPM